MDIRKPNYYIDPKKVHEIINMTEKYPWLKNRIEPYVELLNFCDESQQQELINELLEHFIFLNDQDQANCCDKIKKYMDVESLTADNSILYCFADDSKPDGSQMIMQMLKNRFPHNEKWKNNNFNNSFLNVKSHNSKYKNIILIDDFVGTGEIVERRVLKLIDYLPKECIDYKIYIISFAWMEFSYIELKEKYNIFSPNILKKGLTDFYSGSDLKEKKDLMLKLEKKLSHKGSLEKYYPFGYGSSEALFSIGDINIPNNVFPIFWLDETDIGEIRQTMFRRSQI